MYQNLTVRALPASNIHLMMDIPVEIVTYLIDILTDIKNLIKNSKSKNQRQRVKGNLKKLQNRQLDTGSNIRTVEIKTLCCDKVAFIFS